MKKFLISMICTIVLMFPTILAEAADVPNFQSVAGNNVIFAGTQSSKNGSVSYDYDCEVNSGGDNYVRRYINLLTNNYPFSYDGNDVEDYTRSSAHKYVRYYFDYTGSKSVSNVNFGRKKMPHYCNVSIMVCYYYDTGIQRIKIRVANGLSYGS